MDDADRLKAENDSLRQQVEEYRQRELADLRQRVAKAEEDVAHYRAEAQRNADLGRQIATEYQTQVADLRRKLETLETARTNVRATR